ncbi:CHAP domain-containing protein [Candidatus Saccharibacteria bacterium]|nr:CHAP domain-containing protein [Candidatus Saccharibacteria bacterium]
MVMLLKTKMKNVLVVFGAVILTFVPVLTDLAMTGRVGALSKACENSKECREAAQREEEANKKASEASNSASLFQAKVTELSLQIASMEMAIAETAAEVDDLNAKIIVTEKKLVAEKEALAELLVNMHFEDDSEPIKVLAGAESISDLAEKQARSEVVEQQISIKAADIKRAKEELEADRAKVEELLAEQRTTKVSLESTKAAQEELVIKYQNDASAYEEQARVALAEKIAAEEAEQRANPQLYGNGKVYSGANTYYWQDECPHHQDWDLSRYPGVGVIGGYLCECTSYAGWKAYERYGIVISFWGDAKSWKSSAEKRGYTVDHNPAAGTIGQAVGGTYGHVFWVESVNADGSVNITEYNNYWSTGQLTGSYHMGDFGSQTLSAAQAAGYNYIHLR